MEGNREEHREGRIQRAEGRCTWREVNQKAGREGQRQGGIQRDRDTVREEGRGRKDRNTVREGDRWRIMT